MSSIKVKLDMSKQQLSKLKSAKKNSKAVAIRFSNSQIFKESGHEIEVSPEQYKKLLSASRSKAKRGCVLSFSASQVQSGGFLPMLLSALAGPLISGISNLANHKNFFSGDGLVPFGGGLVPLGSTQRGTGKKVTKKKM
jgi:hypothetical protein